MTAGSLTHRGVILSGAAVVLGVTAEWVGFGWQNAARWLPDLLVGWCLMGGGIVARSRSPESHMWRILVASGVAWFAGNFASANWAPGAWLAAQLMFLHRGLVVHAIASFPTGRLGSGAQRAIVVVGYLTSFAPIARGELISVIVGAVLLAGAGTVALRARGSGSFSVRAPAFASAVVFGGLLLLTSAARLALPAGGGDEVALLCYQAILCAVVLELVSGLRERVGERAAVTDLVVELGGKGSGSLRDGLARALGDPTLQVGYRVGEGDCFADEMGNELAPPRPGSGRAVTAVDRAGRRVAVLVHNSDLLDDPLLVQAVVGAADLAAANAQLHAKLHEQLSELHASRRRLLEAGDDERRRLERRVSNGIERRLTALSSMLEHVRSQADRAPIASEVGQEIARAQEQLAGSLTELGELARGLHPRALAECGLAGALRQLAAASLLDVDVDVDVDGPVEGAVEIAAYFVCAEALSNASKHSAASRVWISLCCDTGGAALDVRDDGAGGASAQRGSGLRGIIDRVEALGGTVDIDSPSGGGTLIAARIPSGARPMAERPVT